ncbi:MAG TPA: hypothetical protein VJ905_03885 [Halalkalibaculum sp.]|nr:hypothetical protein [Halalkalibaculum sp.]
MTLVTKIARLARIPKLLKRKQDAEQQSRKKKKDSEDRPPFPLNKKPGQVKSSPEKKSKKISGNHQSDDKNKGLGNQIDLTV